MACRLWLWVCLALAAALAVSGEGEATQVSVESEKNSGTACEGNLVFFFNLTVTNDDSPESDYDIQAQGAGISIKPSAVHLVLYFSESDVVRFEGYLQKRAPYKSIQVLFDVTAHPGNRKASTSGTAQIGQCTNLTLEAQTSRVEGRPGDNLSLPFNLTDMGNYIDDINLTLEGLPAGWKAHFPSNLTLGGGESRNLTVYLIADSSATVTLRLVATTSAPGINVTFAEIEVETRTFFEAHRLLLGALGAGAAVAAGAVVVRRRMA